MIRRRTSLLAVALLTGLTYTSVASSTPDSSRSLTPRHIEEPPIPVGDCDRTCLTDIMDKVLNAMLAGTPDAVPLTPHAEIRENTRVVALDQTMWKHIKAIRSVMTFADPVTGNVVSRAGVEVQDGRPAYISTRLKVVDGERITDVELSADTTSRVVANYIWNLDPIYEEVLPPEQRMSRVALEALGRRYFHSLSTHEAIEADFDDRCDRYHSGQRITNTANNTVEGGPPRTCAGSLEGTPPWGPATEQRFPVIDEEHGILLGLTLLHYPELPNKPTMYVSEIFKVVDGRIVQIDNIGLMVEGVSTLGFTH